MANQPTASFHEHIYSLFIFDPEFDFESDSDLQSDYFLTLKVILICEVIWSLMFSDSESDLQFDYFLSLKVILDGEVIFEVISQEWGPPGSL